MYVNTETGKDVCVWQWIRKQISESVLLGNIKYRAICMEWRIYSGFKEKTGKRYERYYAG